MANEPRTTQRQSATRRQAKSREGVARRLATIEENTAEIRQQLAALTELLGVELTRTPTQEQRSVSWAARRSDDQRLAAIRLIALTGQRDRLDYERALLRRDLSVELQRRCRNGPKTAEAIVLEQRINAVHAEWLGIIDEIREVQKGAAARHQPNASCASKSPGLPAGAIPAST